MGRFVLAENAVHFLALKKAPKVKVNFRGNRNRMIVRYVLIVLRIAVV